MNDAPALPHVAMLLADQARATIVWTLIDGTRRPAGELAYAANISAQSASAHLAKLVDGGMLVTQAQGRHRYFRIASVEIAALVEGLASLSAAIKLRTPRAPLPSPLVPVQFLHARTCYGHLAGEMAVRIAEAMLKARWLAAEEQDFTVTSRGEARLSALGIDVAALRDGRRVFARACIDLTQRKPHVGGVLGEALLDLYVARGWVRRRRHSRAVDITPQGLQNFARVFRI